MAVPLKLYRLHTFNKVYWFHWIVPMRNIEFRFKILQMECICHSGNGIKCLAHFNFFIIFFFIHGAGVQLSTLLLRSFIGLFYSPWMVDCDDCGAISRMSSRGNRSTRRKPAPVPLCPPQIPHDLTRVRTPATAVGNRLLTAWATGTAPF
jgi:hypothetical protein